MSDDDSRAAALSRLPAAYSLALRLRDAGLGDALIAECLGIEPEALPPLLTVAEAKLRAVLAPPTDVPAPPPIPSP